MSIVDRQSMTGSWQGARTVGRKTSWAKDVWTNYFLGDRRLGDMFQTIGRNVWKKRNSKLVIRSYDRCVPC